MKKNPETGPRFRVLQGGLPKKKKVSAKATDTTDTDDCGDDTDPTDPRGPMGGAPAQRRGTNVSAIARSYNFGEAA